MNAQIIHWKEKYSYSIESLISLSRFFYAAKRHAKKYLRHILNYLRHILKYLRDNFIYLPKHSEYIPVALSHAIAVAKNVRHSKAKQHHG